MKRFSLSTLFLITAVVGLSIALVVNSNRLAKSEKQIEMLFENSSLIRNSKPSPELKIRQHFQLPPYVFKYSIAPPAGEQYRLFVGTGRSDENQLRVIDSTLLTPQKSEIFGSNTITASVTLVPSDDQWRCQIHPDGTGNYPVGDLDWISPVFNLSSGSHLPEFGRVESFNSGRTYLTLIYQNNHESHPVFVEADGRTVFQAGPLHRNNSSPGKIFAIWIEPENEDNIADQP